MISSTLNELNRLHVAIVMDGNGRWAKRLGRPRWVGHRAGGCAVQRIVESAPRFGIGTLTLYAFSADNWRRPPVEVGHLMRLFEVQLRSETECCRERGIRLSVIGRRDRLPKSLLRQIERTTQSTAAGRRLHVRIALDYSARDAILGAATSVVDNPLDREAFGRAIAQAMHAPSGTPDVDLFIRTGGEKRLSDFLLWESAYAEFVFTPCLWPDFSPRDLEAAVESFRGRDRRFGGVEPIASANVVTPSQTARVAAAHHPSDRGPIGFRTRGDPE